VAEQDATLEARLRAALGSGPALRLAVLFGSYARGRARPDSDVDVGIIPVDAELTLNDELSLAAALSGACGREVDLVRLDREEPLLGREVALHGICLFEDTPGVFAAFRADAMARYVDWDETIAPHRARFLARLGGT